MTLLDTLRMAGQCGIPKSQADSILKFAGLVADAERHQCIDILMRLHERSGEVHNYYKFAAEQLRGKNNGLA